MKNKLHKFPKISRYTRHQLSSDQGPRYMSVTEIMFNTHVYIVLEVDTSDSNQSLSTQIISLNNELNLEKSIIELQVAMLKNSLSWPKNFIDNTFGANNHNGISHPRSALKGKVENESVAHWSNRVITGFEQLI